MKKKVEVVEYDKKRPGRPPGYDPDKYWDLFVEAGNGDNKGKWVAVLDYELHYAYQIARRIRSGEFNVPGGIEKWDVEVKNMGVQRRRKDSWVGERAQIVVRRK